jgi:hypothetical protein
LFFLHQSHFLISFTIGVELEFVPFKLLSHGIYYNFNGTHNYIVIVMWRLNGGAPPLLVCPPSCCFYSLVYV